MCVGRSTTLRHHIRLGGFRNLHRFGGLRGGLLRRRIFGDWRFNYFRNLLSGDGVGKDLGLRNTSSGHDEKRQRCGHDSYCGHDEPLF